MSKIKRAIYFLLMLLGFLGVINTISLLFITNVNVGTLLPGFAGIVLLIYAYLKIWVYKGELLIKKGILRRVLIIIFSLFVFSFVIIESIIVLNSISQPNKKVDYVIILGGGIKGKTVSLALKERLDKGIEYLNRYTASKVIVSGGKGFGEDITEAEAMKTYLIERGINSERITMEDKSTSTMENFKFSKKLINNEKGEDKYKIMIITNDFHMMRAKMLARRNGFEPYGLACATPASVFVNCYVREYFAIIKSFIFDGI